MSSEIFEDRNIFRC